MQLQTRTVQATVFSPRLQHAVRLLQMTSADYAHMLREAADDNPFLEVEDVEPPRWHDAAMLDRLTSSSASGSTGAGGRGSDFESDAALMRIPVAASLRSHLHDQLGVLRLDAYERALAAAVVESLDDDGYLRTPLDEIAGALSSAPGDHADALRVALCRVQSLDPAGVAARDVGECLRLQLPAIADAAERALATRIVGDHLALLASGNLLRLASVLQAPLPEVRAAVDRIRKLNARPGSQFGDTATRFITPDVIVHKLRDRWTTVLNDAALPRVTLDATCAGLFEKHRAGNAEMSACLERARWTVQNLAQRLATIRDVAQAIVARQKLFLEFGALAMKPLGLREIGDAVGVHPSTVSRSVNGKYMATPFGVFELTYFFSRGLAQTTGRATAPTAIKALLGELLAAEPQREPLSDAELARRLAGQGLQVARRTVTKYRNELKIDAVDRRRHNLAAAP